MKGFVLIVDDEFGLAEVVSDLLVLDGFEVEIAIDGQLALEAIAKRRPALILSDFMMPVLDGPALRRRLAADPALATIPFILMTALPEAIPPADEPHYDAILAKPFSMAALMDAMNRALAR